MNDIKTWQDRAKGKVLPEVRRFITDAAWAEICAPEMMAEIAELRAALEAARATPAQPVGYVLFTGHGDKFSREKPKCEIDYWKPVYLESSRPSPSSVGAAIRALPLPEPLEIYWPQLNSNALGCGVEDRNIRDRYDAAEYGWQDGVDKAVECVPEYIYTADQVRELLSEAAALAEQGQGQGQQWSDLTQDEVRRIYRQWQHVGETTMGLFERFKSAANAERQWISVEDRLPPNGEDVVVWCGYCVTAQRTSDKHDPENHNGWVIDFDNGRASAITHWLPLPAAPSIAQDGQKSEGV